MASMCRHVQPAGICSWQMKSWARWYESPIHLKPVAIDVNSRFYMMEYFYNCAARLLQPSLIKYHKKHTHFSDTKRTNRVTGTFKGMGSCNSFLQCGYPILKNIGEYKIKSGFRAYSHCNPCVPCDPCGGSKHQSKAWSLKNKVVVITGGSEGIGYIIGDYYLKKKAKKVYLLDVNEKVGCENLKKLTTKFGCEKAEFMKCDVITDLDCVSDKIFSAHKHVHVLINNAGVLNEKKIKKTIDTNVAAAIEWAHKYWEHMRKDKGGHGGTIINLSSIYGFRINQFLPTYQASKFAMMGFTKALGHEYNFKKTGVRVMAICPGFTPTTLTSQPICWDELSVEDFKTFLKGNDWQKLKAVGKAAVDSYEHGKSGTAWLIEGGRPITEVEISARTDKPITA